MANRFGLFLGVVGIVLVTLWSAFFVVDEREQAIVLRFGEIVRVENEPGLNFKLPFGFAGLDTVLIIEDRLLRFDLADIRVQVSGGKFYEVDAFMTYSISDPRKFREQVGASLLQAETRLRSRLDAALRQTYGRRGFEAALSEERTAMMVEVRDQMRPEAENLGVEVVDVRVRRTDLTAEVSDQTFQRMSAERLAEAERIRARGQEAARRIKASADRQVVEIKAEAQRESEILRGEGEGERNRIFAEAYQKDPEFFAFYRSMAAYRTALENSDTTLVLSPQSEFFEFFQDAAGQEPKQAPAN
ncbi:MAG: protease modulator HflC [Rhizobiaceae bacterium]